MVTFKVTTPVPLVCPIPMVTFRVTSYLVSPAPPLSLSALLSGCSSGSETLSPGHCTENHSLCSLTDLPPAPPPAPEHNDPSLPSAKTDLDDLFGLLPYVGRDPCLLANPLSSSFSLAKKPPRELRLVFLCLECLCTQSTLPLLR